MKQIVILMICMLGVIGVLNAEISYLDSETTDWYGYPYWLNHKKVLVEYSQLKPDKSKMLWLGDSILEFMRVEHYFPNSINLGVRGMGTKLLFSEIDFVRKYKAKVVLLYVGGNDLDEEYYYAHVFAYYKKIVDYLLNINKTVICLEIHRQFKGGKRNTGIENYNKLIKKLTDDKGLMYIPSPKDLYEKGFMKKEFTPDGEHLNFDGYKVWADAIRPKIKKQEKK